MSQIMGSVGSYQSGAKNFKSDVETVQRMLQAASQKLRKPQFDPNGIDGLINRIAERSGTVKAISNFQKEQVRMTRPDQRVDVNGQTWKALVQAVGSVPAPRPKPVVSQRYPTEDWCLPERLAWTANLWARIRDPMSLPLC